MKRYKYLKESKFGKVKKFLFSFPMQIIFFAFLIVLFLTLCIFLFYQKLTGFSTFGSIENIPNILKEEKVVQTSSYVDDTSSEEEKNTNKSSQNKNDNKEKGGLCNYDFSEWNRRHPSELRIVNSANPIDKNFKPQSLRWFANRKSGHSDVKESVKVSGEVYDSLKTLVDDALKDGVEISIGSGYRTFEYQNNLFQRKLNVVLKSEKNREKATKIASTRVAKSGQSEHNYGLAIDFYPISDSFEKTSGYKWLMNNAWRYGWILRYTKENTKDTGVDYEPWHFRYVGKYAEEVKNYRSLEEYAVAKIKQRG